MQPTDVQYSMFNDNVNVNRFAVLLVGLDQVLNNNCPLLFDWLGNILNELTMSMLSFFFLKKKKKKMKEEKKTHIENYFYSKIIHLQITSIYCMHEFCLLSISLFHIILSQFQIMKAR